MNSRVPKLALDKLNETKFNESIDFLNEVIEVISQIEVGILKTGNLFRQE